MAPNVVLTPNIIQSVIPTQVLADLLSEPHDTENDLTILLHWLQPYYLHSEQEFVAPLIRVRAAARNCLRDSYAQLKFVDLYVNSIAAQFQIHFGPFIDSASLYSITLKVEALSNYFHKQVTVLNLSDTANDLFNRALRALFASYLQTPKFRKEIADYMIEMTGLDENLKNLDTQCISLRQLSTMGMAPVIQNLTVSVTTDRIHQYVVNSYSGVWDRPSLLSLQQWIRVSVYPSFVAGLFESTKTHPLSSSNDLVRFAQNELVSLRTQEIYDLVVNCRKSEIALHELHQCLTSGSPETQTLKRAHLVESFISLCNLRLLHLGSNTVKIIVEYINTIRAFLAIDPTGVLLDKVARPIRKYLKTRRDLVSHLVKGTLDKNPETNSLYELAETLGTTTSAAVAAIDDLTDLNWIPDPIDALPDFKKGKVSDFVDALTSLLPLPTVLIEEFTKVFGTKLLLKDRQQHEIMKDLENLKSRFGQNEFATLEVMMRDVEESQLINEAINNPQLELTILSRNYWPGISEPNDSDNFVLPILDELEIYGEKYSKFKKGRYLKFLPSMGQVTIELEFENCTKEFFVTPAQAAVIEVFNEDDDEISVLTVALSTRMSSYVATQAIDFWVKHGVLEDLGFQRFKAKKCFV